MGLFDNFFGGKNKIEKEEEKPISWIYLTSIDQLEEISGKSYSKTQMIFKHSTTCGISRMVFNRFGKDLDQGGDKIDFYYLDLLGFRSVSDAVSHQFQVRHQSPQLLIIRDGAVVAHESHGGITEINLKKYR